MTEQLVVETKALPAHATVTDEDKHQITAVVAVYNFLDRGRDVIRPGTFQKSVDYWNANPPMPVLWAHQSSDPKSHIGYALDLKELEAGHELLPEELKPFGGLWMAAQLDYKDEKLDERAIRAFRLLKGGRIRDFSITYKVTRKNFIDHNGRTAREILEAELFEAGPLFMGMNPKAALVDTKSAEVVPPGPAIAAPGSTTESARSRLRLLKLKHNL